MRKVIAFISMIISVNSFAEFSVDIDNASVLKELDIFTINDLGVGESGFVSYWSGLCKLPEGNVGLKKYTELETDRDKYGVYLKVKRKPKERVSIVIPESISGIKRRSDTEKLDHLKILAVFIAKSNKCDEDSFIVDSIERTKSLSELVELVKKKIKELNPSEESRERDFPESTESVKTWIVSEYKSKIDDSPNVTLMLSSNENVYGSFGISERPNFIIRCKENKTDSYIITGIMLDIEEATIRLDSNKAYKLLMSKSTDGKALFFRKAILNTKKIWKHKKMVFRYTPYNSGPQTVIFNIAGLEKEIKPLRKACHW